MLRLWNVAKTPLSSAGTLTDIPSSEYNKAKYTSNLEIQATLTRSSVINIESNLAEGDTGHSMTTPSKLLTSKVISMGSIFLDVDNITDISTEITGIVEPSASLQFDYDTTTLTTTANVLEDFSVQIPQKIPVGTEITILANKEFLTKTIKKTSIGSISITKIDPLAFYYFSYPSLMKTIFRQNSDWAIEVTDTRSSGGRWYLYAHILSPLTFEENTLDNALVFKSNSISNILSSTPLLVYTGTWNEDAAVTTISWDKLEGFLLELDPNDVNVAGNYETNIYWEITNELKE